MQGLIYAQMVELVDTPDLGSGAVRYVGSSPILGNPLIRKQSKLLCFALGREVKRHKFLARTGGFIRSPILGTSLGTFSGMTMSPHFSFSKPQVFYRTIANTF